MTEIIFTDDTLSGAPRIKGRRIGVHHITKPFSMAVLTPTSRRRV